jgi:hypothetical protein
MPKSHSVHLKLEQLPKLKSKEEAQLALYLESVMTNNLSDTIYSVELPSIQMLSEYFDCSSMQLYDAMRALRVYGYDYQFSGLDGSVQIWSKERKK